MTLDNVSNELYTRCGVTAPVALWLSAGMEFVNHGDTYSLRPKDGWAAPLTDGAIIEARVAANDGGEQALVWLITERRRQWEERERIRAFQIAADAQKKAGDDAIHAARIQRQAAELECLARGVKPKAIDSRLE